MHIKDLQKGLALHIKGKHSRTGSSESILAESASILKPFEDKIKEIFDATDIAIIPLVSRYTNPHSVEYPIKGYDITPGDAFGVNVVYTTEQWFTVKSFILIPSYTDTFSIIEHEENEFGFKPHIKKFNKRLVDFSRWFTSII